ncbi:MAG: hypothetical protein OXG67_09870 [bacterium]|nr:hypothetical protein [bacterium]MCY3888759.1 hypothetical protein [bacterium]
MIGNDWELIEASVVKDADGFSERGFSSDANRVWNHHLAEGEV